MSKVFVTNEPYKVVDGHTMSTFDLTPALEFGQLEVLLPAGASLISTVPMVRKMRDALAKFSDDDYLLPAGSPASIMAAGAIAAEMNCGRVKILQWDRRASRYLVVQVDTSGRAT